jgi:nucleoside-diphosphate-sugar epimerase
MTSRFSRNRSSTSTALRCRDVGVRLFDRVLVTGGAGYVGSALVPRLLDAGYEVTVLDGCLFGPPTLPVDDPRLHMVRGDIRDARAVSGAVAGQDAVIHLACISNDPSFELDPELSTSINLDAFEPLVTAARDAGARRFIYCSSSSVYGVSELAEITEDAPLNPLTLYSRFKAECEPIVFGLQNDHFEAVTIRPATVCGYAPRCRLDLSVNILTNHAVNRRLITVFGGAQLRPNLHIDDMCDAYGLLLEAPSEKIRGETFNVGHQNLSIDDIALLVRGVVERQMPGDPVGIVHEPTDDLRSYHINSDKVARVLGYRPSHTIEDAVVDLCHAFKDGLLPDSFDDDRYYNVRVLRDGAVL